MLVSITMIIPKFEEK